VKIYGITTCGSVKKALKFMKDNGFDYEFIDFKKEPPSIQKIEYWMQEAGSKKLLNTQGTKYKTLKLKELNLDEEGIKKWMVQEPLIIKRPVIEDDKGVVVGFDEDVYKARFSNA